MMLARPTAAVSVQKRSSVSVSRAGVAAPLLRPNLACRFKEDDRLEQTKQKLENNFQDTKNDLQRGLQQTQDKLQNDGSSYDPSAYKVNPAIPAFTRRREVFSGRLAMLGFFAACCWEYAFVDHPNILQQISGFSQGAISPAAALLAIVGLIGYNLFSASVPGSPTFSQENQEDISKRPRPATAADNDTKTGRVLGVDPKSQLGVTGFGFSKANEVFVGRVAMVGFTAAIIGQLVLGGLSGPGPLGQVAYYLGTPAEAFYASAPAWFIPSALAIVALAYLGGKPGPQAGEEDIY